MEDQIDIDFVITWVDGNNPEWRALYNQYRQGEHPEDTARFREWGLLKYWFRAVEAYAPWVHKIYFVTSGELPDWMNLEASEKLVHVKHEDFIPAKYLPTFSSRTINLNLHRISGLSEHFVYFDDDMFLNGPIKPTYFFRKGLPCDAPCESIFSWTYYNKKDHWGNSIVDYCNIGVLNRHFNRYKTIKASPFRWLGPYLGFWHILSAILISRFERFQRFHITHQIQPYLKSVLEEAWEKESEWLDKSCSYKFRNDVSLNQWFFRYWQFASNLFYPCRHKDSIGFAVSTARFLEKIISVLQQDKLKCICLNDSTALCAEEFILIQSQLINAFGQKLMNKSIYEK